ncbi:exopolyphosphatase PRUNE1 [Scleropages formosus]|uniref:Prune exopolyphosphatase n=1 Tax=Scleropages formosus TaxID=113540 RepID=A0A8C9VK14_SCLFO|nr:exopolyphosphatase PRUNE1 [Scleropages formosus]
MEGFLRSRGDALKRSWQDGSEVHIVLGNETCDLDSMVSALVFAYFLHRTSGKTAVPVLNIKRSELALRTDSTFLLRQSGLPQEALVFRDEVDLPGLGRAGRLALTLVDHNILPSADGALEGAVVEVIDHHVLERTPSDSCAVTLESVGSCATLVTECIAREAPELLDRQMAQLLYGTIVLDCVNMAPEARKVTPKDSQYAVWLESRFPDLPPRGALFQSLQNAKFDVSGLTTEQMLLKDMKATSGGDLSLAVSVVYVTLEAFLQRRGLQQELCEFCHKYRFGLLVAMTISYNENNEPFRQLAVYSSSTLYREEVSRALENAQNPCLKLSPISSPYADVKAYLQGNIVASRKKVLPIIKDFLREWEHRVERCGEMEELEELEYHFDPSNSPGLDEEAPSRSSNRWQAMAPEEAGAEEDCQVPPTPMNSLVEGCPLDNGLPRISPEAILEKFNKMAEPEAAAGGQ